MIRIWLIRPYGRPASTAAPASARCTCTWATVRSPTTTTLSPRTDSRSRSTSRSSTPVPRSAYITSYSTGRSSVIRRCVRWPARADVDQSARLGGATQDLDQHVEQQHVRLAAGVDDPRLGQSFQLLRRTLQRLGGRRASDLGDGQHPGEPDQRVGGEPIGHPVGDRLLGGGRRSGSHRQDRARDRPRDGPSAGGGDRRSTWARPRSGSVGTISPDRSSARLRLMIISATIAPELPWADSTAARTTRSAGLGSSADAGAVGGRRRSAFQSSSTARRSGGR